MSLNSWNFSNGILQLEVDFNETIEGFPASLTVFLNKNMTLRHSLVLNTSMISNYLQLIYEVSDVRIIKIVYMGFMFLVCSHIILTVFVHKTIGLEELHVYQLIYFIFAFSSKKTLMLSMF